LVFSLYLQSGQGFSALGAGLAIFAYSIGAAITASNADAIATKIGNRVLTLGAGLLMIGMLSLIVTTRWVGIHPHIYSWIPAMAISGLGFGFFVPPVIDIVLINVDRARAGIASGALATLQQVGGAVGVAVIGIIFFGLLGNNAPSAAGNASPTVHSAFVGTGASSDEASQAAASFDRCFTERARSADPTVMPPGCGVASTSGTVSAAYDQAANVATAHNFSASFARTLWSQVIVYLIVLGLIVRLPKANPRQRAERQTEVTGVEEGSP
jgi:MFS family permease